MTPPHVAIEKAIETFATAISGAPNAHSRAKVLSEVALLVDAVLLEAEKAACTICSDGKDPWESEGRKYHGSGWSTTRCAADLVRALRGGRAEGQEK